MSLLYKDTRVYILMTLTHIYFLDLLFNSRHFLCCKPPASFPCPRFVETGTPNVFLYYSHQKSAQALKVDGFRDPAVKTSIHVELSVLFDQRCRHGKYWDSTNCWMSLFKRPNHRCGLQTINDWHLSTF